MNNKLQTGTKRNKEQEIMAMMERHCPSNKRMCISANRLLLEELVAKAFEFGIGIVLALFGHPFIGLAITAFLLIIHGSARHPDRIGERIDVANMPFPLWWMR